RGVILVELHPVGLRQVPLGVLDEGPMPGPEHVGEQLPVMVQVVERERSYFHFPFSFLGLWQNLEGGWHRSGHSSLYSRAFRTASDVVRASSRTRADVSRALKALSVMPSLSAAAECRSPLATHCKASICALVRSEDGFASICSLIVNSRSSFNSLSL